VPGEKDVRELYELREALETQSARLFAERATPAQCLELRRLAEQVDVLFGRLETSSDDAAFRFTVHSHHVELHMRIAEHARSEVLKEMIERSHVLILNWLFDLAGRRTPLPPGFHARLVEALVSGDPAKADAAMRAHVRYGLAEVTSQISMLEAAEGPRRRGRWRTAAH
jgi:DNA-binding GntR family transcriptional regulator